MRITLDLPEEAVSKVVQRNLDQLFSGRVATRGNDLDVMLKSMIVGTLEDHPVFRQQVARAVNLRLEKEIESAVNQKVPGWVKRQVKEMLRYATAQFLERNESG